MAVFVDGLGTEGPDTSNPAAARPVPGAAITFLSCASGFEKYLGPEVHPVRNAG